MTSQSAPSSIPPKAAGRTLTINRLTLAKWIHLQGRARVAGPVSFTEVKLGAGTPARWAFELTLPNGFVVRAADAAALAQLLAVARS